MRNKKRLFLKSAHIIFSGIFLGSVLCICVLLMFKSNNPDEMFGMYQAINLVDAIIALSAMLTFISGLLITYLTNWGFKYTWIKVKLVGTIFVILFGILITGRLKDQVLKLFADGRLTILQNPDYLHMRQELSIYTPIVVPVLIGIMFVSTYKPWGKGEKGE